MLRRTGSINGREPVAFHWGEDALINAPVVFGNIELMPGFPVFDPYEQGVS